MHPEGFSLRMYSMRQGAQSRSITAPFTEDASGRIIGESPPFYNGKKRGVYTGKIIFYFTRNKIVDRTPQRA
jgi:hypothetical protein